MHKLVQIKLCDTKCTVKQWNLQLWLFSTSETSDCLLFTICDKSSLHVRAENRERSVHCTIVFSFPLYNFYSENHEYLTQWFMRNIWAACTLSTVYNGATTIESDILEGGGIYRCLIGYNCALWTNKIFWILHSEDHASWYILIIKTKEMH